MGLFPPSARRDTPHKTQQARPRRCPIGQYCSLRVRKKTVIFVSVRITAASQQARMKPPSGHNQGRPQATTLQSPHSGFDPATSHGTGKNINNQQPTQPHPCHSTHIPNDSMIQRQSYTSNLEGSRGRFMKTERTINRGGAFGVQSTHASKSPASGSSRMALGQSDFSSGALDFERAALAFG